MNSCVRRKVKAVAVAIVVLVLNVGAYGQPAEIPADPCYNNQGDVKVKIYPVPTARELTIDMGSCFDVDNTLIIFDNAGREVVRSFFPFATITIHLPHLVKGPYVIRITNSRRKVVRKILTL